MGTRCLVNVYDTEWGDAPDLLVTIYRQYDGYPDGMGKDLKDFCKGMTITNGISREETNTANGAGCFAAQLISHLKAGTVGNVYLFAPNSHDVGEEYAYHLYVKSGEPIRMIMNSGYGGEHYDGEAAKFPDKWRGTDVE